MLEAPRLLVCPRFQVIWKHYGLSTQGNFAGATIESPLLSGDRDSEPVDLDDYTVLETLSITK